jgi:hypothetical protein
MAEKVVDVFVDGLMVTVSAYGCIAVDLSVISQVDEGAAVPNEHVATLRMTPEFIKGVIFVMYQHVVQYEQSIGGKIPLPPELIEGATQGAPGTREQWDQFWR